MNTQKMTLSIPEVAETLCISRGYGTQYKILVENRSMEGWKALEEEHPDEMDELKGFLKRYPTNLRVTNGKAKRLRGNLKEYHQYDVTYSDRVRYQVDKRARKVTVVYAGPHP